MSVAGVGGRYRSSSRVWFFDNSVLELEFFLKRPVLDGTEVAQLFLE